MKEHVLPRILIVDDTPTNIEILLGMLEDSYDTSFATSGRQALELLAKTAKPDLILLDVMMPEMDGYEVCAALKSDPNTREIPVIFVTARTDAESETRALSNGGVDFVHKPVNKSVLRARVALHLELERRARALSVANTELTRHRDHLEDLVHERVRELALARDEAESANRAKSIFLTNIGHEFLTPLHQIMGLTYLARRDSSDERSLTRMDHLERASQRLHHIIHELLTLSRAESERLVLEIADFDLQALCTRVIGRFDTLARSKGLELVQQVESGVPLCLRGDVPHLEQMLDALLSNAVKFSERGRVRLVVALIAAREKAVTLRFAIEDQGVGLSPEARASLFEPFRQGDDSMTRRYEGLGLGLALTKRLVSLMGGEIGVESTLGEGSVFWFSLRLPIAEATPVEAGQRPAAVDEAMLHKAIDDLAKLLEQCDVSAYSLYFDAPSLYEPALKGREEAFRKALGGYDFEEALAVLRG
ncbi:MAG: response regulator [Chromatiales bacterium]|nr:response regulator [Chromatiales bacterium]